MQKFLSRFEFDTTLAVTVLFLLIFGLIMITSIGVPKSIALSAPDVLYPSCSDANVDCYLLFKKHLVRMVIALVGFLVFLKIPVNWLRKFAPFFFAGAVLALFLVSFLGNSYGTIATTWVTIFDTSVQPSEFAKIALILYLAHWLSEKKEHVASFHDGFIPFGIIVGMMILPIILQNDFGTAMVMGVISAAMFFMAGARVKHLGVAFLVACMGLIIVVSTVDHVQERFKGFTRIDAECLEDYCWQSQQANIAIGSGGFWGKGLTQGVQKSYWLPQASDDFIFAASAEELGFIRIILVVIAYFIISIRGFSISNEAENSYESLVALGITTWIVFQAFLNIAVNTALFPVTGITLPFISYGGTSLVSSLMGIAILLNISQKKRGYAPSLNRGWNRRSRHTKPGRYRRY